jgi:hypothetical protein
MCRAPRRLSISDSRGRAYANSKGLEAGLAWAGSTRRGSGQPMPEQGVNMGIIKPIREEWARTVDCLTKLVTALAIIFGGWWTVHQYTITRADQVRNQTIEARKPLAEKRLQIYLEATSAAATIATSPDKSEVERAKQKFWILYSGPMRLINQQRLDNNVLTSMQEFGDCLRDGRCALALNELSQKFATECGYEISRDWLPARPSAIAAIAH